MEYYPTRSHQKEKERESGGEKLLRALKGKRPNHGSDMWITSFQALLSKHNSFGIFQSFKSLLIASSHVKFGRPLPLFTLLSRLMMPLCTGASEGLRWTCLNHLNRC
ncbi:Mediator of RNA polymerase II transcription subunit 15a [Zea mays]|uniref:Mediator of RNA polymerase II transcription subunit 15a n=1 Tax=Zea mays TaxID=4577 RepID=A0A1D6PYL8_MAIZE|nr:Mediator of RNA polymerase II transcription subunit 15a [Zea mays]